MAWVRREASAPSPPPVADTEALRTTAPARVEPDSPAATGESPPAGPETPVPAAEAGPPAWLDEAPPVTDAWEPAGEPAPSPPQPPGDEIAGLDWEALAYRVAHCEACELHRTRTHTVFGVGDRSADLMLIGEAPGAEEDRKGEPFVGRAGQLLDAMLRAMGLGREQVFIANILKCRPPGNRDPRPEEVVRCEPYLRRQVALVGPRVILALGRVAAQNLLKSQEPVGRLRGKSHRLDGIPVVVTYHPAYLLRSPEQKGRAWQDLQRALALMRGE